MIAMILAAGRGTRLEPLTRKTPKALVDIHGYPLIQIIAEKLKRAGFNRILVNIHHHHDQMIHYLDKLKIQGVEIIVSDEQEQLLDTGGAIKKAAKLMKGAEAILVHNVDILSDMDLRKLYQYHLKQHAAITLAVKNRKSSRYLLMDQQQQFCGWSNPDENIRILRSPDTPNPGKIAFSGVYVFSPKLFDAFPEENAFPLFPWLLKLPDSFKVIMWDQGDSFWYEVGRTESLMEARDKLQVIPSHPGFLVEKT